MNKIFSMVIGVTLLSAQVASAQVTEADLMGAGMPALQAETVYDLATQGTVADDLAVGGDTIAFAAAGTIATTGSGTDLTLAPIDTIILKGANDDQRIITYSATSDTFLSWLYGDSATANQAFAIYSNTSASTDSDSLALSGGGDLTAARGAYLHLKGADASGGGDWTAVAADSTGSNMSLSTSIAAGTISLLAGNATPTIELSAATTTTPKMLFGDAATASQNFVIGSMSADAADDDLLSLSGGGAASATRGAHITLQGNEFTGGGDGQLIAGSAAGSTMLVSAPASDGTITLATNAANALVISSAQAAAFTGTITSSATGSLGWSMVSGANTACTTTCTGAAVFGYDAGTNLPVGPADATADHCICASAS